MLRRRHAIGIAVAVTAAVAATLVLSLATASAQPTTGTTSTTSTTTTTPPSAPIGVGCIGCSTGPHHAHASIWRVEVNDEQQPVAGRLFTALTVLKAPASGTISWVQCDAKIAGKLLRARQQSFYAGPHQRWKVICRWHIPADAGGKRLRFWNRDSTGHVWPFLVHIWPHIVAKSHSYGTSWYVARH